MGKRNSSGEGRERVSLARLGRSLGKKNYGKHCQQYCFSHLLNHLVQTPSNPSPPFEAALPLAAMLRNLRRCSCPAVALPASHVTPHSTLMHACIVSRVVTAERDRNLVPLQGRIRLRKGSLVLVSACRYRRPTLLKAVAVKTVQGGRSSTLFACSYRRTIALVLPDPPTLSRDPLFSFRSCRREIRDAMEPPGRTVQDYEGRFVHCGILAILIVSSAIWVSVTRRSEREKRVPTYHALCF